MSDYEYFSNCPIYGFERHETVEEARKLAKELIQDHLKADGSWSEFVEQVCGEKLRRRPHKLTFNPIKLADLIIYCEYELKQPD